MQKALNPQRDLLLGTPDHPTTLNHRRYDYSKPDELLAQRDRHRGPVTYRYDGVGQVRNGETRHPQLGNEDFAYDPAGNLTQGTSSSGNRIPAWGDWRFTYDRWGNLAERRHRDGCHWRFTYEPPHPGRSPA